MGRKKKKYIPDNYASLKGEGDTSANIYMSMMTSLAWKKLTPRAGFLYLHMRALEFGNTRHDKDSFEEVYRDNNKYFTFNESKWLKGKGGFELYSNKNSFYTDIAILIELGFIDCVECGESTRTKSLYKFSSRWQTYGTAQYSVPEKYKTTSMRGTRKKSRTESIESKEAISNDQRKEKLGL